MARKKSFKIPGVSFSPNRALGITAAKRKISRATGVPLSKAGRQRKAAKMMGCGIYVYGLFVLVILGGLLTLIF